MLEGIAIVTVLLSSSMVSGQTEDFEHECRILKTLDYLEARLQQQEIQLKQKEDRIQELEVAALRQAQTDCGVLFANGSTENGIYVISPDGRCPFSVYCDMTGDGWTVIQRRVDGNVNFHRTWNEYVQGFGNVDGEYWLGLDKIHRLTKDGAEIYFDIGFYNGSRSYAHYKSFTVHDATSIYRMNVDAFGYTGSMTEGFSYHNDMKFSTYDRDNDASDISNCAQTYGGGGWWYKSCSNMGILNGVFGKNGTGGLKIASVYIETVTIKVKQRPC